MGSSLKETLIASAITSAPAVNAMVAGDQGWRATQSREETIMDYAPATKAIVDGRLDNAWSGSIKLVASDDPGPLGVVQWLPAQSRVVLHRTLRESARLSFFANRLLPILTVLEAISQFVTGPLAPVSLPLNLDDVPGPAGIAFVTNAEHHILIPDPNFIRFEGYKALKQAYAKVPMWQQRIPVAFWRGDTSGKPPADWRALQRLELCRIALREPLVDAGITSVVQLPQGAAETITDEGLRRAKIPAELHLLYRALISIDGNSCAFDFYCALLTGAPVLKVASPGLFRQWFYYRLKPWVHFVPVESVDMSDLPEKVKWIMADGHRAAKIGEAGRTLALTMTAESEIGEAAQRIARVVRKRGDRPVSTRVAPAEQPRIIQSFLEAHPELTRLIFVHVPKCAGTDLSATLNNFPSIHQTITSPNWQKPDTLGAAVARIEKSISGQNHILVHGHFRLRWVVNNKLYRQGDRLFTVVRDPHDQLVSQINYYVSRFVADPKGNDPDTAERLRKLGLSSVENYAPSRLLEIVQALIEPNPICLALGDETCVGALQMIRQSRIEITDTSRYTRWGQAIWGVPFDTRHNASTKFITSIDKGMVKRHCGQDLELYMIIRERLGEELFVYGDAL
jgi:hypothetical protein